MKNKYIKIKIATYCLPKLLYVLNNNGVRNIAITMEDNELYVVLDDEELDEIVYPRMKNVSEVLKDD